MDGIKTFAMLKCIISFTLLSSNSASPMMSMKDFATIPNSSDGLHASNNVGLLRSFSTNAPHPHIDKQLTLPLLKKEVVDENVAGEAGTPCFGQGMVDRVARAENSLIQLRVNRVGANVDLSGTATEAKRTNAPQAINWTLKGIQKEKEAYKALAQGRFEDADQLISKAIVNQKHAHVEITSADVPQIDLQDERVKKAIKELEEQVHKYNSLPTIDQLRAAIKSSDEEYSEQIGKLSLVKNQHTSTLVNDQGTSSVAIDMDTSRAMKHQEVEPFLNTHKESGWFKHLRKATTEKMPQVYQSCVKTVEANRIKAFEAVSNYAKNRAEKNLLWGDREAAVEWIKQMQVNRKRASASYKAYSQRGFGTLNMSKDRGQGHDKSRKSEETEPSNDNLSSEQLDKIKRQL